MQSNATNLGIGLANKTSQHSLFDKLLSHCRTLETQFKQFQKAKDKGHTKLPMITTANASTSPIHQDTLDTQKNVENAVTTIPRESVLHMEETVTTVA